MFQITAQCHGATTQRLRLRDYNSENRCCGGTLYAGPRQFRQQYNSNRRHDYDPSFSIRRHEYHTDSRNHQYRDDYYYKPNKLKYSDHKSPPLKYPYHKEYPVRKYNNPSWTETKYMQKRTGFVFPDTHKNINDGRGVYKPYNPPPYFQDHRYHGHQGYHDLTEDKHRWKYRPALLGVSVGTSGGVVVMSPDGYKHVIHNLPPWTQPNTTPEREHYKGSFQPQGSSEHLGSHRFTTGFHESPGVYEHQNYHHQTYKGVTAYYLNSNIKNRNQEQGAPTYSSNIPHQTYDRGEQYYKVPSKPENFHPSPPFYKYSEPDPLHHPNGLPLQTYSPTEPTQHLTTSSKASATSEHNAKFNSVPEKSLKYPHSINAQLPPPALDTDTTVPYEATQQIPNHHITNATQVPDANYNTSLIQALPTEPPGQGSTESEVSSSTVIANTTLPTLLIQETSINPEPAKVSIHPTQTVQTDSNMKTEHFLPTVITEMSYITPHHSTESQTFNTYMIDPSHKVINKKTAPPPSTQEFLDVIQKSDIKQTSSAENKNYTAIISVTDVAPVQSSSTQELLDVTQKSDIEQTSSAENKNYTAIVSVTDVAPIQSSSTPELLDVTQKSDIEQTSSAENKNYTAIVSVTDVAPVQSSSTQELLDVIQKSDIEQTSSAANKNYTAIVSVTDVSPVQRSSDPNMSASGSINTAVPTEGNTAETIATQTVHNSTETKNEDNSNLTEDPNSDSEDEQPTVETYTTEEAMYKTTNEPNLHASSMLKELHTLMNHAQSLNYLYQDSSTTVSPADGGDQ